MTEFNDLDAMDFFHDDAPRPEISQPPKCRRHDWVVTWGRPDQQGNWVDEQAICKRCGRLRDPDRASRGRRSRNRGNSIEREVAAKLGLRRVGQFGGPDDARDDYLIVQVKSGGAFPERIWSWLNAMSATAAQTRAVVLTDAPGPGRRRRAVIVTTLDEWVALHGDRKP